MDIVERIKKLCKEKHTSMNALEKELGFGNGSIRNWDKKVPSAEKALAVAKRLDVSIDWLLTGEDAADLSQDELKLLDLYKNTNDIGQPLIIKHAADTQSALPREKKTDNIETELKSSDLKIG